MKNNHNQEPPTHTSRAQSRPAEPGEVRRTEIVLEVEDRPGALATIGEVLGEAGANIVAAAAVTIQGKGIIHLVVDDSEAAQAALKRAGIEVKAVREVLAVTLDDRPGELGRYARSLANAGLNIQALYIGGQSGGEKEVIVALEEKKRRR